MLRLIRDGKELDRWPTRSVPEKRAYDLRKIFDLIRPGLAPTDEVECTGYARFSYLDGPFAFPIATYTSPAPPVPLFATSQQVYNSIGAAWHHDVRIDAWDTPTNKKPYGTPGFLLTNGPQPVVFKGWRLSSVCQNLTEDGSLIGWGGDIGSATEAGDGGVRFEGCVLDARNGCDWGVYGWVAGSKTVEFVGGEAGFCRWLVALNSTGSNGVQTTNITGLRAYGYAAGSRSIGDSSRLAFEGDPTLGASLALVLQRGGKVKLSNVDVQAYGLAQEFGRPNFGCNRIAALGTDRYYKPPVPGMSWEFINCRSVIAPGLAAEVRDHDVREPSATVSVINRPGSNQDGSLKGFPRI